MHSPHHHKDIEPCESRVIPGYPNEKLLVTKSNQALNSSFKHGKLDLTFDKRIFAFLAAAWILLFTIDNVGNYLQVGSKDMDIPCLRGIL